MGEAEKRRSYKLFGDKSNVSEKLKDTGVKAYQVELANQVFPNGGQLRDYQAEGVTWLVSNLINGRSSFLTDGKKSFAICGECFWDFASFNTSFFHSHRDGAREDGSNCGVCKPGGDTVASPWPLPHCSTALDRSTLASRIIQLDESQHDHLPWIAR